MHILFHSMPRAPQRDCREGLMLCNMKDPQSVGSVRPVAQQQACLQYLKCGKATASMEEHSMTEKLLVGHSRLYNGPATAQTLHFRYT